MTYGNTYKTYIFKVKIQLFVTAKSDQDPDPDQHGSALVWLPEPVFVNLLRSPGIDSQDGGPLRQLYLLYRPDRLHRLAESIPRNRCLGSLNVYKYGLWIRIRIWILREIKSWIRIRKPMRIQNTGFKNNDL
jgi:hypothetical protein